MVTSGTARALHVRDLGSGPAVLLLHGAPTPPEYFGPLVEALRPRHRVIFPDLPGYGASPPITTGYALAEVYRRLEDELLRRGIEEVATVGFSAGGHHAIAMAASTRVRVTRIVALAAFAALDEEGRAGMRQFAAMLRAGTDPLSAELRPVMVSRFLSARHAATHPVDADHVASWAAATSSVVLADELEALADADVRPLLPRLAIPVVARVGQLDAAVPPRFSEEIARLATGGRLEVAPACGHALLYEDPSATVASVLRALVA